MFHSQDKQDEYLEQNVFHGFKNGVFMDVGAHNGITINNTLYFEKNNNWSGINIEPIKKIYEQLIINRPTSININCAVYNNDGTTKFIQNSGYTEMLSGIQNNYDKRHLHRLQTENKIHGSTTNIINVNTRKIETICSEHSVKHINYLSIDVEGAEFEVIKSINFDTLFIDVIGFEDNYTDISTPIIQYLQTKNYVVIHKSFDIFMIHKNSVFYKPNNLPTNV